MNITFHPLVPENTFINKSKDKKMPASCAVCGKTYSIGYKISHAHNKSKKIWRPNLQRVRAVIKGTRKKIRVCTRCIRSGKIAKG